MSFASVESRADPQEVLLLDPETLDPNLHYRWVANNHAAITKRTVQGYRLVSRKEDGVRLVIEPQKASDDYFYNGDTVLMCCEKERVEGRQKQIERIANQRLRAPVHQVREQHGAAGFPGSTRILEGEEGEF